MGSLHTHSCPFQDAFVCKAKNYIPQTCKQLGFFLLVSYVLPCTRAWGDTYMSTQERPGWGQESCWSAVTEEVAPMRFLLEPSQGVRGFLLACAEAWFSEPLKIAAHYQLLCTL